MDINPAKKNFDLQFFLLTRYAGVKMEQKLWEWPTNAWFSIDLCHMSEPTPDITWCAGTQRLDNPESRTKPNMTDKKINVMMPNTMFCYIHKFVPRET